MLPPTVLRCGPTGWSSTIWNSLVTDRPATHQKHPLELLSRCFDTVEISTTFRSMPRPELSQLWLRKVARNPEFQFTAMLHRQFTHDRKLADADVEQFKAGLRPLLRAGKLGALVMQFPWSFRFTQANRDFLIALRRTFHEFPLAAEMRHESWAYDEAVGTFVDYRIGYVNLDQPRVMRALPPTTFLTSSVGMVRLHGRDASRWNQLFATEEEACQTDYQYSRAELDEWRPRIEKLQRFAGTLFVTASNDFGLKAIQATLDIEEMLGTAKAEAISARSRVLPPPLVLAGAA